MVSFLLLESDQNFICVYFFVLLSKRCIFTYRKIVELTLRIKHSSKMLWYKIACLLKIGRIKIRENRWTEILKTNAIFMPGKHQAGPKRTPQARQTPFFPSKGLTTSVQIFLEMLFSTQKLSFVLISLSTLSKSGEKC